MNYFLFIISIPITAFIFYYLIKKPLWLLGCYIVAVPILPPLPIGSIELSALDFLTIPTLIHIIYNFSKSGYKIKGAFTIGLFLYVAAAVVSFISFTLQNTFFSTPIFLRLIRLIEMFLPVLLASQIILKLQKEKVISLFLIGGGLAAVAGLVMYLSGYSMRDSQSFGFAGELIYRAGGTHGDSGSFGNLMGITSLLAIWVLIYSKVFIDIIVRRRIVILASVSGAVCFIALTTSLSRGGVLLLALGICVLLFPLLKQPGKLLRIFIVTAIIIFASVGLLYTQIDNFLINAAFEAFQTRILELSDITTDFESVSSHRTDMWRKSWNIYSKNPTAWPLGLGYKSLRLHYNIPPDNNFFQSLFEMGIPGIISLLTMIIFGFKAAREKIRFNLNEGIVVLALWLGYISSMVTGDYLTCWHNVPVFFILLGVLSKIPNQKDCL